MFGNMGVMSLEDMLALHLTEFDSSEKRKWMIAGDKYYKTENDIINKQTSSSVFSSNNKLAHGYMKKLVDEKVNYLLAKDYSLASDGEEDIKKLNNLLGNRFKYELLKTGYESSNKGISYIHPYVNKDGKLLFKNMITEECCPIWSDNRHEDLEGMLRYYTVEEYQGYQKEVVTKVEYWTSDLVRYYIYKDRKLIIDSEKYLNIKGEYGHYTRNGQQASWGKVPFIPFKNNEIEFNDLRFVKSLVDSYDKTRSENANYIEDVRDLIYILKGYGGEDLKEFMQDLKDYRAVKVDGDDGGIDTLNPNMDISASKEHFEQLDKDIIKFGQGVLVGQDSLGNSPSGIALKFLYGGLDLKCNSLEREFQKSFLELQHFSNVYLKETSQGVLTSEVTLVFNRDIAINESDTIKQCNDSVGIISDETIIENHPWIKDPKSELEKLQKEKSKKIKEEQKAYGSYDFNNTDKGMIDNGGN